MILFSWGCTALVLLGFIVNANKKYQLALILWIIGDVGWIIYDAHINNWSHATLSTAIIFINLYGIYRNKKVK